EKRMLRAAVRSRTLTSIFSNERASEDRLRPFLGLGASNGRPKTLRRCAKTHDRASEARRRRSGQLSRAPL
ncbi:MAG: hypothetical protein AVDCRST_MAG02-1795, partial [uncultured Rubrobacteraceae bacterium]